MQRKRDWPWEIKAYREIDAAVFKCEGSTTCLFIQHEGHTGWIPCVGRCLPVWRATHPPPWPSLGAGRWRRPSLWRGAPRSTGSLRTTPTAGHPRAHKSPGCVFTLYGRLTGRSWRLPKWVLPPVTPSQVSLSAADISIDTWPGSDQSQAA